VVALAGLDVSRRVHHPVNSLWPGMRTCLAAMLVAPAACYLSYHSRGRMLSDPFLTRAHTLSPPWFGSSLLDQSFASMHSATPRYERATPSTPRYVSPPPPPPEPQWASRGDYMEMEIAVPPQAPVRVELDGSVVLKATGDGRWGEYGREYSRTVRLPFPVDDPLSIRAVRNGRRSITLRVMKPSRHPAKQIKAELTTGAPNAPAKPAAESVALKQERAAEARARAANKVAAEQAKVAAEKAAVAKKEAEADARARAANKTAAEQAKVAAEKAAAAKKKAAAEARTRAANKVAAEQAKVAAEKAAAAKKEAEAEARTRAADKVRIAPMTNIHTHPVSRLNFVAALRRAPAFKERSIFDLCRLSDDGANTVRGAMTVYSSLN